jgi:hypothetical protein
MLHPEHRRHHLQGVIDRLAGRDEVRGHHLRVDIGLTRIDRTDLDAGHLGSFRVVPAQGQGQHVLETGQPIATAAKALDDRRVGKRANDHPTRFPSAEEHRFHTLEVGLGHRALHADRLGLRQRRAGSGEDRPAPRHFLHGNVHPGPPPGELARVRFGRERLGLLQPPRELQVGKDRGQRWALRSIAGVRVSSRGTHPRLGQSLALRQGGRTRAVRQRARRGIFDDVGESGVWAFDRNGTGRERAAVGTKNTLRRIKNVANRVENRSDNQVRRDIPMAAETQASSGRRLRRTRWRSLLGLGLLGTVLTLVGLSVGPGGLDLSELFARGQGYSDDDWRQIDEIKKLGGETHILERTPPFLGVFGGHGLLTVSFHGQAMDDAALARFVRRYGERVSRLYLSNTGITDASLRHLAGLSHLRDLELGNSVDPSLNVRSVSLGTNDPLRRPVTTAPLNTVTDAGLVHLKGLTRLQSLNLNGLPVTDAGLDAVKDLPNLGGLYLDSTRVRGPGLGRLKSLPGLAVLYLDRSSVTDDGLRHLKGASNLQVLSLAGVPLTGQGLTHLKALPKLHQLGVNGCGISSEDLNEFTVTCPVLKPE